MVSIAASGRKLYDAHRTVDAYGRVLYDENSLFEIERGSDPVGVHLDLAMAEGEEFDQYQTLVYAWDKPKKGTRRALETLDHSPEDEHRRRQETWLIPDRYKQIDVRQHVLALAQDERERDRLTEELDLFERFELFPVIRLMMFLIDDFRARNVVWGCGRGSSVASYVLFKLGVHKVDSLRYELDIREFLKD